MYQSSWKAQLADRRLWPVDPRREELVLWHQLGVPLYSPRWRAWMRRRQPISRYLNWRSWLYQQVVDQRAIRRDGRLAPAPGVYRPLRLYRVEGPLGHRWQASELDWLLGRAMERGCLDHVQELARRGGRWSEAIAECGWLAAKRGHRSVIRWMLEGDDLPGWARHRLTELLCDWGPPALALEALRRCQEVHWPTIWTSVCQGGKLDLARHMVRQGAPDGGCGLLVACAWGRLEIGELLLQRETDWPLSDATPLWEACDQGHLPLVGRLVGVGFRLDTDRYRAVYTACRRGHLALVQWMLPQLSEETVRWIDSAETFSPPVEDLLYWHLQRPGKRALSTSEH